MQSEYSHSIAQDGWMELTDFSSMSDQTYGEKAVDTLTHFQSHFVGCMELRSDAALVTDYLQKHQGWFCRCAHPMQVQPVEGNGYLLTVGRYGSLGFEVEPKIAVRLLPPDAEGVYRIETIPGLVEEDKYEVSFKAALQLVDRADETPTSPDALVTHVEWTLDLGVSIAFPRFINRLPHALIQGTGDRLLQQIVRQVSRRLTAKVQDDFHKTHNF
jgi:Protein of unknown function (DUF1997)